MEACEPDEITLDDIVRFNEAIDQAIAESISFFSAQVDQARNLLLGMLGHDMRSPLNTINHWQPDVPVSDIGMPSEDGYS